MALQSSGEIDMLDIVAEFGGSVPHSLSEYYRNGGNVPGNNTNVPTSGQISMSNFYNAVNEIQVTVSANTTNYQVSNAFGSNWATAVPKRLTINSGVTLGSSNSTPAMVIEGSMGGTLIVHNSGNIIGHGGAGSSSGTGGNGYNAVRSDQNGSITFYNNSGAGIYAGGGGGGRGGNGGQGGTGGTGGTGGNGSYTVHTGQMNVYPQGNGSGYAGSSQCQGMHTLHNQNGGIRFYQWTYQSRWYEPCRICGGSHFLATGGYVHHYRNRKGKLQFSFQVHACYSQNTQSGAGGGAGGSGGAGGAGGAGGNGRGYNQNQSNGAGGSAGAGGNSGSGGGNNGNGSGTGGTGGTGGQGGTGGTGGNGGGFGAAGGSGATGNTGASGATGNSGANGNGGSGHGGAGGSSGSGGAGGSAGGSAGYYIQNRHYLTLHNSGSVAGQ